MNDFNIDFSYVKDDITKISKVNVLGTDALAINCRVDPRSIPDGFWVYQVQHDNNGFPRKISNKICEDFKETLVMDSPLHVMKSKDDYFISSGMEEYIYLNEDVQENPLYKELIHSEDMFSMYRFNLRTVLAKIVKPILIEEKTISIFVQLPLSDITHKLTFGVDDMVCKIDNFVFSSSYKIGYAPYQLKWIVSEAMGCSEADSDILSQEEINVLVATVPFQTHPRIFGFSTKTGGYLVTPFAEWDMIFYDHKRYVVPHKYSGTPFA